MTPTFVQITDILAVIVVVVVDDDILITDWRQASLNRVLFARFAHGIVQIRFE